MDQDVKAGTPSEEGGTPSEASGEPKTALPCPFCGHPAELRQPVMPTLEECLLAEPNAKCSNIKDRCLGRYLVASLSEWNKRTPAPVPGLPSSDPLLGEMVEALRDIASWSIPRKRLGAALEHIRGVAEAAITKYEARHG